MWSEFVLRKLCFTGLESFLEYTRFVVEQIVNLILISFYLLICNLEFDFLHVVLYLRKLYNPCECVNLV